MEEASRGAAEAGGTSVGILPGLDADAANAWVTLPIPTGLGHARNVVVASSGDAVVAVGGSWGTLSELAFAKVAGRPVVALGSWSLDGATDAARGGADAIERASDPDDAVRRALALAATRRPS